MFCCKVVAGLNWNCLSHELMQLLNNLQVHTMSWRDGGGGSWSQSGGLLPQLVSFGVARVQLGGQQLWCETAGAFLPAEIFGFEQKFLMQPW